MGWLSVHVHYDDDQDGLILDAIGPLFAAVEADGYFLRHWKRGPHLRLNLRPRPGIAAGAVRDHVHDVVGSYVAAHPSRGRSDPAMLAAVHERLALMEAEPGPLVPWVPDNTLVDATPDDRAATLGGPAGAALLTDVHLATGGLVLELLEGARTGGNRLGRAFDLVVAAVHAFFPGGAQRGFVSCRSHAEAFLSGTPEGPSLRPTWERHSAATVDRLAERVLAVEAALDGTGPRYDLVERWVATLDPLRGRGEDLIGRGLLALDAAPPGAGPPPALDGEFHRALAGNRRWHDEVATTAWFGGFRLALNWTYLQLTRLGIAPVDRFLICHLVADAVERAHDVSAMEAIRT